MILEVEAIIREVEPVAGYVRFEPTGDVRFLVDGEEVTLSVFADAERRLLQDTPADRRPASCVDGLRCIYTEHGCRR